MSTATDFKVKLAAYGREVERGIQLHVPRADTRPARLHAAMRYSLEAGGKRLRPILTLAIADLRGARTAALPAAIAIECIHTYSLIHDDLPAMDNDDLRRGRPTCHKQFDEATAILAGDALLTHAFALLGSAYASNAELAAALVRELAQAAGSEKLIGGQIEDILAEEKTIEPDGLEFIQSGKTAALFAAAAVCGGLIAAVSKPEIERLRRLGYHLGRSFQALDDILDVTAGSSELGKTPGKDARAKKATIVSVHGLAAARQFAQDHTAKALAELAGLTGDVSFLNELIRSLEHRAR